MTRNAASTRDGGAEGDGEAPNGHLREHGANAPIRDGVVVDGQRVELGRSYA